MHALFVIVVLLNVIIYVSMAPPKQQLYKRTTISIDLVVGLATIGTWHWTVGFCWYWLLPFFDQAFNCATIAVYGGIFSNHFTTIRSLWTLQRKLSVLNYWRACELIAYPINVCMTYGWDLHRSRGFSFWLISTSVCSTMASPASKSIMNILPHLVMRSQHLIRKLFMKYNQPVNELCRLRQELDLKLECRISGVSLKVVIVVTT